MKPAVFLLIVMLQIHCSDAQSPAYHQTIPLASPHTIPVTIDKAAFLLGPWTSAFQGGFLTLEWRRQNDSLYTADQYYIQGSSTLSVGHNRIAQRQDNLELELSDGNYSKTVLMTLVSASVSQIAFESPKNAKGLKMKVSYTVKDSILEIDYSELSAQGNWQDHTLSMHRDARPQSGNRVAADEQWVLPIRIDTMIRQGYTACFLHTDSLFLQKGKNIEAEFGRAFFHAYPQEAAAFNKNATHQVMILFDRTLDGDGVALTKGNLIRVSSKWMLDHPEDIDLITHEAMHIVQDYGYDAGPAWLIEGIADYARAIYGINNAAAGWSLPAYAEGMSYTDGYRVTAAFLVWLENSKPGLVKALDQQLKARKYSAESWKQLTGLSLEELWSRYSLSASSSR